MNCRLTHIVVSHVSHLVKKLEGVDDVIKTQPDLKVGLLNKRQV